MLHQHGKTTKMNLVILLVMAATLQLQLGMGKTAAVRKKKFPCWSTPLKPYLITYPCYTVAGDVLCRCSSTTLDCSSNFGRLNYIPSVFSGAQVLNFSNNELRQLDDDKFFLNASRSVRVLDLYNNEMTSISPSTLRPLRKLSTVLIGGNNLTYEQLWPVFGIPTIKIMDIKCGNLGTIPTDYFNKSLSLQILDMSWNNINTLDMHVLQPLWNIRKFALQDNKLYSHTSAYLPSLESLSLRGNRLYNFPATCKGGSMNESFFPSLTKLNLAKNHISSISDPVCLPRVTVLDLQYNTIQIFSADFSSVLRFPALKQLFVNEVERKITGINAYAFNNSGLQYLGIGYNSVDFSSSDMSDDMLAGCSGLTELYLNRNIFKKVSKERLHRILQPVQNLEILYMAQVQIEIISSDTFINLPHLKYLYLYENSLFSVPDGAFDHLPRLKHLDLGSNHISKITKDTFSVQTQQQLVSLDLSNNPFQCGCDLLWFQQWMRERPGLFTDFDDLGYRCDNVHNEAVHQFHINPQECIWDTSVYILIISFTCFFIIVFLLFIGVFGYRWHIRLWLYSLCQGLHERSRRHAERQMRGFRYDVFLGYAEEDVEWVHKELLPVLEQKWRLRVCVHQRDFLPGKHIVDNISDSIEESDRYVMVFSPDFTRSQWCQFELKVSQTLAMERDDIMILLMLHETEARDLSSTMLAILQTTTYLEWMDEDSAKASFWGRLELALGDVLRH
ncbi:toll-like receptor 2 [Babylonia areolata]|uniref:toll-like receptor 2 n=1 Tax=Babylonia areolata TaxID=304850 RepID=UPI003FD44D64